MPPVLAGAVVAAAASSSAGAAAALGTTIIGSLTVGSALTGILSMGLSMGLSMLLQPGAKKSIQSGQVTAKDPNPRRIRGYGQDKLGGYEFFLSAPGGAFLYRGIVHCEGPISNYVQFWLNDTDTLLPDGSLGGVNGAMPWLGAVTIESHLGEADQAASGMLMGAGGWTEEHRLKGLAYSAILCVLPPKPEKNFQKVFPSGAPTLRVVARLSKVYDPRPAFAQNWNNKATWAWRDNAALCILDFLTHERVDAKTGRVWRFVPKTRINLDSWKAFAGVCDQAVQLKAGGQEPRYRIWGIYDLAEEPRDVLQRMLAACDGELVSFPDGSIGIKGGTWEEPEVTLTDEHITRFVYAQGNEAASEFNHLKFRFKHPENDYQVIDGDPCDDLDAQADSGKTLSSSADFSMAPSHTQARRLAKIAMHKANPRHKLTGLVATMPALALLDARMVRVRLDYLEIDATFVITRFQPSGDLATVTLDLSSLDQTAYAWDENTEEGTPPAVGINPDAAVIAPDPENVTVTAVYTEISAGVAAVQLRAAADDPSGTFENYWTLEGLYREVGAPEWLFMTAAGRAAAITEYLRDGGTYEVMVRFIGLNQASAYSAAQTVTVASDAVAPGSPASFVANGFAGYAQIAWTAPNSTNVKTTRLYRAAGASSVFEDAAQVGTPIALSPNQSFDMNDSGLSASVYRYWVTAANASGVESVPTGPVTVTVT